MSAQPTTLAAPPAPITVEQWGKMEGPPFYEQDVLLIKFAMFLSIHVEQRELGYLAGPTTKLRISALGGRMPDLFLITPEQVALAGRNVFRGVPPFAVEVLSPSTEHIDRTDKRDEYAAIGIGQYWLIDFRNRAIEVYELRDLPDGGRAYELTETVGGDDVFRPSLFPGLEIPLARVWPTAFENRIDD